MVPFRQYINAHGLVTRKHSADIATSTVAVSCTIFVRQLRVILTH